MTIKNNAFQLGIATDKKVPSKNQAENKACNANLPNSESNENLDFFIKEQDITYAGTHLTIDLWGASNLDNIELIRTTLKDCAITSGATILHDHLHHFTPNGGISGVIVLAESHISIHTWPERGFAALDIFMCGEAKPKKSIAILKQVFKPTSVLINDFKRGVTDE